MSNSGKVLIGVLAGAAAGVITGVLIAPSSGKETRDTIQSKTDELLTNVKEVLRNQKEKVGETVKKSTGAKL
ncbi:MAG: YtxH domain-containing protein [Bacteroidales bacterium]